MPFSSVHLTAWTRASQAWISMRRRAKKRVAWCSIQLTLVDDRHPTMKKLYRIDQNHKDNNNNNSHSVRAWTQALDNASFRSPRRNRQLAVAWRLAPARRATNSMIRLLIIAQAILDIIWIALIIARRAFQVRIKKLTSLAEIDLWFILIFY